MTNTTDATDSREHEIRRLASQVAAFARQADECWHLARERADSMLKANNEVCALRADCEAQAAEIARLERQQEAILAHYRGRLADVQAQLHRERKIMAERVTYQIRQANRSYRELCAAVGDNYRYELTLGMLREAIDNAMSGKGETTEVQS